MSHRIVLMNDGRVEQVGTPSELWAAPATRFAASFLGATNRVSGMVVLTQGHTPVLAVDDGPRLHLLSGTPVQPGDRATAFIRTSAVELRHSSADGAVNLVPAEIIGQSFHGDYSLVVVRCGGLVLKVRTDVLPGQTPPARFVYLDPAKLMVFRDEDRS